MADKISKEVWTRFTKKQSLKLDDSALLKALERLDKTPEKDPQARAQACEQVAEAVKKQVTLLVKQKKELGDKVFGLVKDQLYELLDQAESLQKALIKGATESEEADDDEEDEVDDTPAALTTAMVPLVRVLQKGEVQMHALIAHTSGRAAVLITKKAISPSKRKLLTDHLGEASGVKFVKADVAGSKGMLEFLLESPASGMSKKLRAALLEQTGLRLKVFVQHGDETETDGDEEEGDATGSETGTTHDAAAKTAYQQKLTKVGQVASVALKKNHPEATKVRALLAFAQEKADKLGDFAAASKALDALVNLLQANAGKEPVDETAQDQTPDKPSFVGYAKARLSWLEARQQVSADLKKLEKAILEAYQGSEVFNEAQAATRQLDAVLKTLDESLADKLDEGLNAADPAARSRINSQASALIGKYLRFIHTNPLMAEIDDNPFVPLNTQETLSSMLRDLDRQLS